MQAIHAFSTLKLLLLKKGLNFCTAGLYYHSPEMSDSDALLLNPGQSLTRGENHI